jgi:hypothetical protein
VFVRARAGIATLTCRRGITLPTDSHVLRQARRSRTRHAGSHVSRRQRRATMRSPSRIWRRIVLVSKSNTFCKQFRPGEMTKRAIVCGICSISPALPASNGAYRASICRAASTVALSLQDRTLYRRISLIWSTIIAVLLLVGALFRPTVFLSAPPRQIPGSGQQASAISQP